MPWSLRNSPSRIRIIAERHACTAASEPFVQRKKSTPVLSSELKPQPPGPSCAALISSVDTKTSAIAMSDACGSGGSFGLAYDIHRAQWPLSQTTSRSEMRTSNFISSSSHRKAAFTSPISRKDDLWWR